MELDFVCVGNGDFVVFLVDVFFVVDGESFYGCIFFVRVWDVLSVFMIVVFIL